VISYVRAELITVAVFAFLIDWGEFVIALSLSTKTNQPVIVALNIFVGQYGMQWSEMINKIMPCERRTNTETISDQPFSPVKMCSLDQKI